MNILLKNKSVCLSFLLISYFSYAGSLIKVDLSEQDILKSAMKSVKNTYRNKYGDAFKKSAFGIPHITLLFLSKNDDASDLEKIINSDSSVAELVKNAASKVVRDLREIKIDSSMKISHGPKNPFGVPSSDIEPGTDYYSVVLELPEASSKLSPLMNKLKGAISAVVKRPSATDFEPRIHLTVGYVINKQESEKNILRVENLKRAKFNINGIVLDFPKIEGFNDLELPFTEPDSLELYAFTMDYSSAGISAPPSLAEKLGFDKVEYSKLGNSSYHNICVGESSSQSSMGMDFTRKTVKGPEKWRDLCFMSASTNLLRRPNDYIVIFEESKQPWLNYYMKMGWEYMIPNFLSLIRQYVTTQAPDARSLSTLNKFVKNFVDHRAFRLGFADRNTMVIGVQREVRSHDKKARRLMFSEMEDVLVIRLSKNFIDYVAKLFKY